MASSQDFARLVTARLALYAAATTRAMFGGFGVFVDGMMIGLIAGDVFHLKADDQNRPDFEAAGMGPFTYDRRGKPARCPTGRSPKPSSRTRPWARRRGGGSGKSAAAAAAEGNPGAGLYGHARATLQLPP